MSNAPIGVKDLASFAHASSVVGDGKRKLLMPVCKQNGSGGFCNGDLNSRSQMDSFAGMRAFCSHGHDAVAGGLGQLWIL